MVDCRNRFRRRWFPFGGSQERLCVDGRGDVELEQPWGERGNISLCDCVPRTGCRETAKLRPQGQRGRGGAVPEVLQMPPKNTQQV